MLISYSTYQPSVYNQDAYTESWSSSLGRTTGGMGSESESASYSTVTDFKQFDSTGTVTSTFTFIDIVSTIKTETQYKDYYTTTINTVVTTSVYSSITTSTENTTSNTTILSSINVTTPTTTVETRPLTAETTLSRTYTQKDNALTATMVTINTGIGEQLRILSLKDAIYDESLYAYLEIYTDAGSTLTIRPDDLGMESTASSPTKLTSSFSVEYSLPSVSTHDLSFHTTVVDYTTITTYEPVLYPPLTRSYATTYSSYKLTTISQEVNGINTSGASTIILYDHTTLSSAKYTINTVISSTIFYPVLESLNIPIFSSKVILTTKNTTYSYDYTAQNSDFIYIGSASFNYSSTFISASQVSTGQITGTSESVVLATTIASPTTTITNITEMISNTIVITNTLTASFTSNFTIVTYSINSFSATVGTVTINSILIQSTTNSSLETTYYTTNTTDSTNTTEISNVDGYTTTIDLYSPDGFEYYTITEVGAGNSDITQSYTSVSFQHFSNVASMQSPSIYYPVLGFGAQKYDNTQVYYKLTAASTIPYPFFTSIQAANIFTPLLYDTTITVFYSNKDGIGKGCYYSIFPSGNVIFLTSENQTNSSDTGTQKLTLQGNGTPTPNSCFLLNYTDAFYGLCGTINKDVYIVKPRGLYVTNSIGYSSNTTTTFEKVTKDTTVITSFTLPNSVMETISYLDVETYLNANFLNSEEIIITSSYTFITE